MDRRPPMSREAILVLLRSTLLKLEHATAPENDTLACSEFERVLRVRIAKLEAESAAIRRLISLPANHNS
jgi:hypothetical protein